MKILSKVLLDKEAKLFDTTEFLVKTFVAVLLGYQVGRFIPYVSQDMISLLFGMMMCIEPVNMTGVRAGFKQVEATVIGALITGVILALFGYSMWTAALTITATLYVSLLIDWRNYSVVAVFTAIYMNTFVQSNALGDPSQIETFRLRISALMTGVAIALVINWVFSVFSYKHMLEKRVYHIMDDLTGKMKLISDMIEEDRLERAVDIMRSFPATFNNIDWIYGTALDLEKDPSVKRGQYKQVKLEKILKMTWLLREMCHINYDICYRINKGDHHFRNQDFREGYRKHIHYMDLLMENLERITRNTTPVNEIALIGSTDETSLQQMNENIGHVDDLLRHYI